MATTIGNLMLDGQFADWPLNDIVERPGNTVTNYQVYGALVDDATGKNYVVGINAAVATDPVIANWLTSQYGAATAHKVEIGAAAVGAALVLLVGGLWRRSKLQPESET